MNDLDLCLEIVSRSRQPLLSRSVNHCVIFDNEYLANC